MNFLKNFLKIMMLATMVSNSSLLFGAVTLPEQKELKSPIVKILDGLVEKRPVIFAILLKAHEITCGLCQTIDERKFSKEPQVLSEAQFVEQTKEYFMPLIQKFLGIVFDQITIIKPIIEESLGRKSEVLEPFFNIKADEKSREENFKAYFEGINTTDKLFAIAQDIALVTHQLSYEKNLKRSHAAYQEFLKKKEASLVKKSKNA